MNVLENSLVGIVFYWAAQHIQKIFSQIPIAHIPLYYVIYHKFVELLNVIIQKTVD